ncbi:MAG: hypothetical protein KF799_01705 [Bdellovibrionales bacterium]|nr:hypothetical protein [Bdellovibrionales bacterium]
MFIRAIHHQTGFALMEILAVIALAALVVVASMELVGQGSLLAAHPLSSRKANALMQSMAKVLMSAPGNDGTLGPGAHFREYDLAGNPQEGGPIHVEWKVYADMPMVGLYEVELRAVASTEQASATVYKFVRLTPNTGTQHP